MKYQQTIRLKDGRECVLRSGTAEDGQAVLDNFILTHTQTDNLVSYPDEITMTAEGEGKFMQDKADSPDEMEILAEVGGKLVALAGFGRVSPRDKMKHRAEFGISVDRAFWGLGIGRAMTRVCIDAAKKAGYAQLELEVVADNRAAIALYESEGFTEYGRNPLGFRSRTAGWQELVLMRLVLSAETR